MLDELPALAVGEGGAVAAAARRHRAHRPHRDRDRRRRRRHSTAATAARSASPAATVVWAAGVSASRLAGRLAELAGAERRPRRTLTVEADLTLPGHPEVFAIGDMVRVRERGGEAVVLPGVAPVAMQQGRYAAQRRPRPATRARPRRLSLPRQGQPGDDRASSGSRRHQRRPAQRLSRLGDVAPRPPLVPDRLPESAARPHPLVVQLRDPRSRRATHHKGSDDERAARRLSSRVVDNIVHVWVSVR